MRVRWTLSATQDRIAVFDDVITQNPAAAARLDALFMEAAASLSKFPLRGRAGAVAGTRELIPHPNYRLVYQVDGDVVSILALAHTSRLWPPAKSAD